MCVRALGAIGHPGALRPLVALLESPSADVRREAQGALAEFLEIMRRDRKFDDDLGRKALIAAFDLVQDPELVSRTRRQMASILF